MGNLPAKEQSLCWSCARAYALPDPLGCAFHRKEHTEVFDEATRSKRKYHDYKNPSYSVICVTKCKHYEPSARDAADRKTIEKLIRHETKEA